MDKCVPLAHHQHKEALFVLNYVQDATSLSFRSESFHEPALHIEMQDEKFRN